MVQGTFSTQRSVLLILRCSEGSLDTFGETFIFWTKSNPDAGFAQAESGRDRDRDRDRDKEHKQEIHF